MVFSYNGDVIVKHIKRFWGKYYALPGRLLAIGLVLGLPAMLPAANNDACMECHSDNTSDGVGS